MVVVDEEVVVDVVVVEDVVVDTGCVDADVAMTGEIGLPEGAPSVIPVGLLLSA
jgi:hypothetical protein